MPKKKAELERVEVGKSVKIDELGAEISSLRDQLRRATMAGSELSQELSRARESGAAAEARATVAEAMAAASATREGLIFTRAEALAMSLEETSQQAAASRAAASEAMSLAEARRGELEAASAAGAASADEAAALRTELERAEEELRHTAAALDDQAAEFKIAQRRTGQLGKELKEQLRRETKVMVGVIV